MLPFRPLSITPSFLVRLRLLLLPPAVPGYVSQTQSVTLFIRHVSVVNLVGENVYRQGFGNGME